MPAHMINVLSVADDTGWSHEWSTVHPFDTYRSLTEG